jgi:protein arginine kinase activator
MQCDVCKTKEAEVFLTQIVEGKIQKVNLCKACSKERGVDDPTGFALTELLTGLGTSVETEKTPAAETRAAETVQKCPVCGFTQADFKKTGRLGCSECYRTFSESLGNLLKAMHKGTSHTGKMPARMVHVHELTERMKTLQEDLQKAVNEENYESAASLRDQIRHLSNQIEN